MSQFKPKDPAFEARIRTSFAKQGLMNTLGASLVGLSPGTTDIALAITPAILQQHGFVHGGGVASIADAAAGYAALSLMPPNAGVLTVEFKINFVAPATGDRLIAYGRVLKTGRTLTLAQTEVMSETDGRKKLVAFLTATLISIEGLTAVSN